MAGLDEAVDLVQEERQLLDLVDDHPLGWTTAIPEESFEQRRVRGEAEIEIGSQEVDNQCLVLKLATDEEALSRRAWAEEKEGLPPQECGRVEQALEIWHCSC